MSDNCKEYIITYNNFYNENCMLELECVKNNEYVTKSGHVIPTNHLFTHGVNLTDKEKINLLTKHRILNGDNLKYYNQDKT